METFTHTTSEKNDGQWQYSTPYERAIIETKVAAQDAGLDTFEWEQITIKKLECDAREDHYPDLCWHYEVTIS